MDARLLAASPPSLQPRLQLLHCGEIVFDTTSRIHDAAPQRCRAASGHRLGRRAAERHDHQVLAKEDSLRAGPQGAAIDGARTLGPGQPSQGAVSRVQGARSGHPVRQAPLQGLAAHALVRPSIEVESCARVWPCPRRSQSVASGRSPLCTVPSQDEFDGIDEILVYPGSTLDNNLWLPDIVTYAAHRTTCTQRYLITCLRHRYNSAQLSSSAFEPGAAWVNSSGHVHYSAAGLLDLTCRHSQRDLTNPAPRAVCLSPVTADSHLA